MSNNPLAMSLASIAASEIGKLSATNAELVAALKLVRGIIIDGGMTGFNPHDGDWATRLFESQAVTHAALSAASGRAPTNKEE